MRPITIKPALNGYICTVGCQTVVFMTPRQLCDELEGYLRDPHGAEAHFLKNALNPMENLPSQPVNTPMQNMSGQGCADSRTNFGGPEPCPAAGSSIGGMIPPTMRERALAGTLPAPTPPLNAPIMDMAEGYQSQGPTDPSEGGQAPTRSP